MKFEKFVALLANRGVGTAAEMHICTPRMVKQVCRIFPFSNINVSCVRDVNPILCPATFLATDFARSKN
jgi:hypothetical protein